MAPTFPTLPVGAPIPAWSGQGREDWGVGIADWKGPDRTHFPYPPGARPYPHTFCEGRGESASGSRNFAGSGCYTISPPPPPGPPIPTWRTQDSGDWVYPPHHGRVRMAHTQPTLRWGTPIPTWPRNGLTGLGCSCCTLEAFTLHTRAPLFHRPPLFPHNLAPDWGTQV